MVTRELIKHEIDQVQEEYLEFLYRVIRALGPFSEPVLTETADESLAQPWAEFVNSTYGMFAEAPIERAEQGEFEVREVLE